MWTEQSESVAIILLKMHCIHFSKVTNLVFFKPLKSMCVRVYVCEQLVLPESLLNYLKPAFRILNIMLLCLFLTFSGTPPPRPPKLNEYLSNMIVNVLP